MAYKFQLGAAKLGGAVESTGQVKGTSLDASEGNVTNVGALTADSIGKDDGASELGLADDMRAATNKQIQFRAADQRIFSPAANEMAIEASSSINFDVNATGTMKMSPGEVQIRAGKLSMSGSGKLRYGENMESGKFLVSDGNDYASVALSNHATLAANGALTIANDAVGADQLASNAVVNASIAANAAIDIDKLDGGSCGASLTTAQLAQGDLLYAGDVDASNVIKSITFSNLEDAIFGNVSGDATVAAGGALTIANDAVEQAMIADDAVGADQLASNAVVNASVATNAAIALNKINTNVDMGGAFTIGNQSSDVATFSGGLTVAGDLIVQGTTTTVDSTTINISSSFTFEGPADDNETVLSCGTPAGDLTVLLPQYAATETIHLAALADAPTAASCDVTAAEFALLDGGSTVATGDLADGDGFLHNDGGTMKQTSVLKIAELAFSKISGDATVGSNGALTLGSGVVEHAMLAEDIISGQAELASGDIADADELMISDNGTIKRVGVDSLRTFMNAGGAPNAIGDANATLAIGVNYASADTSTARTWTLPASPSIGQSVRVKVIGVSSGAVTIARAGSQMIDGETSIVLESDSAAVELVYVAADDWRVF